jgi:hypothetical protein
MIKVKKFLQGLTLFDYLLVALLFAGVVFFAFIFFRKQQFLEVVVKVSDENVNWASPGTKDWFSSIFYAGMKERDGLGRPQAEVIKVFSYDTQPERKDVFLTLNLRGVYTKALDQYSYKGRPILVGYPIKLQLDSVNAEGIIVSVGNMDNNKKVDLTLEVRTWDDRRDSYAVTSFTNTTGVRPYVADAIDKESVITDNNGNEVIKVIDKKVVNAKQVVTTSDGRVLVQSNPLLKDMTLTLQVRATIIGGKYYFFNEIPILIGQRLPLNFQNVSIFPDVAKITVNDN